MTEPGRRPAAQAGEVVAGIRSAILDGMYAPGQRLIEVELCEQYDASRFVVRTALKELAADGLLELEHNRGARVRVVPMEEALEIIEVRMVLEGLAAARAARRATPAEVQELVTIVTDMGRAVAAGELATYGHLNAHLHGAIRRISANETCSRTLERLRGQIVRQQFALSLQPGRPAVSLPQHERIVAAIEAGDAAEAEAAMRAHLTSVIDAMRAMPAPIRLH